MNQGADPTNILRLYAELGVSPDQGVGQLTRRYRQRLHELHPDVHFATGEQPAVDPDDDGIGWLTRSYREALAFEREHGRLPGAERAEPTAKVAAAERLGTGMGRLPPRLRRRSRHARRTAPSGNAGRRWLLGGLAASLLVVALAPELELELAGPTPQETAVGRDRVAPRATPALPAAGIRVGSSEADVLRIQGEPHSRSATVWAYGPSYIRFENGRVLDWHSSPLQPLKVSPQAR